MDVTSDSDRKNLTIASSPDIVRRMSSKNDEMLRCIELAHMAGRSSAPVMITGETGTGKSLLAMFIHYTSPKRVKPCIALKCGTIQEKDIKSRLFGDAGRESTDDGLMVRAAGGTLIIDAVDMLPAFVQRELLGIFTGNPSSDAGMAMSRKGQPREPAARLVSTSGGELAQKISNGLFYEELMYSLGEITIRIPPLRERREDMPDLTREAVEAANRESGKQVKGLSRTAYDFFRHYDFPGNVRELFLIINRAVKETGRDTIYVEDLGRVVDSIEENHHLFSDMTLLPLAEMEKRHINKALLRTGWKKLAAARILRISESMLNRKIMLYGLGRGDRTD